MPESNRPKGSIKKEGFMSPAPGDLEKKGKEKLAKVYASVRKTQGGSENKEDKEKAARIAWSQVNKDEGQQSLWDSIKK
jgi:hypothetical protein